ncbi:hypothetical protein SCALM49S_08807 [Streptomyces californicus]
MRSATPLPANTASAVMASAAAADARPPSLQAELRRRGDLASALPAPGSTGGWAVTAAAKRESSPASPGRGDTRGPRRRSRAGYTARPVPRPERKTPAAAGPAHSPTTTDPGTPSPPDPAPHTDATPGTAATGPRTERPPGATSSAAPAAQPPRDTVREPTAESAARDAEAEQDAALAALRQRLVVSTALAVPVVLLAMVPAFQFDFWQWLSLTLAAPVVVWGGLPFHRATWTNLRHGAATMDTLVSLGTLAAFGWSLWALFLGDAGMPGMRPRVRPDRLARRRRAPRSTWRWRPGSSRSSCSAVTWRPAPNGSPARRCGR